MGASDIPIDSCTECGAALVGDESDYVMCDDCHAGLVFDDCDDDDDDDFWSVFEDDHWYDEDDWYDDEYPVDEQEFLDDDC